MIRIDKLLLVLLLIPINSFAGEDVRDVDDYSLKIRAVEYASQADAYNIYCEKDSALANDFIDKFYNNKNISQEQEQGLRELNLGIFSKTEDKLNNAGTGCKDLEFMMQRLEVMRNLKDVSYLLNGVDPATAPELDIPNMEELMPKPKGR